MSNLKAMKFKVNSPEHSEQIQKKLFEMGYFWCSNKGCPPCYTDKIAIYANYFGDGTLTYSSTLEDFEDKGENNCEEYFLVNGEFVPKSYWTQPYTGVSFTIHGPESEQFKKAQKELYDRQTGYTETIYEPLGITPRADFLRSRNVEILQAMLRYTEANMTIPSTWFLELEDNNEELDNEQN